MKTRTKRMIKSLIALAAALTVVLCSVTGFADEGYSLTVACEADGGTFSLYRVGEFTEENSFYLSGDFAEYSESVNLSGLTADGWIKTASTLYNYSLTKEYSPLKSGILKSGSLKFEGLSRGLYLVSSAEWSADGYDYKTEEFLVCLPNYDEDLNLISDVTVSPKISKASSPAEEKDMFNLLVLWVNDNSTVRPAEVEYTLFKDGESESTFKLGEVDNWQSVFENLETGHVWTVTEGDLPTGYTITIKKDDETNTIIITNTYTDTSGGGGTEEPATVPTTAEPTEVTEGTTAQEATTSKQAADEDEPDAEETTKKKSSGGGNGNSYVIGGGETDEPSEPVTSSTSEPVTSDSYVPGEDTFPGGADAPADEPNPPDTAESGAAAAPSEPGSPSAPVEILPQTGQLWFPVPILAVLGIVFYLAGYVVNERENDED